MTNYSHRDPASVGDDALSSTHGSAPAIRDLLHRTVPLGTTPWAVFGAGLLRSAGFSADGLDLLQSDALAKALEDLDRGDLDADAFTELFEAERVHSSNAIAKLCADPDLLTAITWQNPQLIDTCVAKLGPIDTYPRSKRRNRERAVASYWQRYCSKAESIGYFGPISWIPIGQTDTACLPTAFSRTPRATVVRLEAWAINAIAAQLADAGARWWFPPLVRVDHAIDPEHGIIRRRSLPPLRVPAADLAVLSLIDGMRTGPDILTTLRERHPGQEFTREIVEKIITRYARKRLVHWNGALPISPISWQLLSDRVDAIDCSVTRIRCQETLARFNQLIDQLTATLTARPRRHRDIRTLIRRLDQEFTQLTQEKAQRHEGRAYAARTIAYFDCDQGIDTGIGRDLLERISAPLDLVLRSADWFAAELTARYTEQLTTLISSRMRPGHTLTLADVWAPSMSLFWGDDTPTLTGVTAELSQRWNAILGDASGHANRVCMKSADIAAEVHRQFPLPDHLIPAMAVHSPDIHILTSSAEEIAQGNYQVVISELHACLASCETPLFEWPLADRANLIVRDAINTVLGSSRIVPLFPEAWRRNTGRTKPARIGTSETGIGFTTAIPTDPRHVVPAGCIELRPHDTGFIGVFPDQRTATLAELWAVPLSILACDAFKIGLPGSSAPRLTIDDLVLFRQTWQVGLDDLSLPGHASEADVFATVDRWRRAHQLPSCVFMKFPSETKPVYVDFTSPLLVSTFTRLVRQERLSGGSRVTASECLPHPQESWLTDEHGGRYTSEFRFHVTRKHWVAMAKGEPR